MKQCPLALIFNQGKSFGDLMCYRECAWYSEANKGCVVLALVKQEVQL